ncbi:MAG TPA: type II secretion system protein [Candidatus Hydrogenedentes bacterium]|nr:type II secretion system protein [Candidatus Hydrogenedentota bacterium]HRT19630.1 type II secretion system protein [Candidatus Hydrogenedentota bacterium]
MKEIAKLTDHCARTSRTRGFTLLEILVAIVVMGTGITVFVSLFGSSLALAQSNRLQTVAMQLAGECLHAVMNSPERYEWRLNSADPGALTPVTLLGEPADTRHSVHPPSTIPADRRSSRRDHVMYQNFTWQAYARVPEPGAAHVELTVVVRWNDKGRPCAYPLTSCLSRSAIPAKEGDAK